MLLRRVTELESTLAQVRSNAEVKLKAAQEVQHLVCRLILRT